MRRLPRYALTPSPSLRVVPRVDCKQNAQTIVAAPSDARSTLTTTQAYVQTNAAHSLLPEKDSPVALKSRLGQSLGERVSALLLR